MPLTQPGTIVRLGPERGFLRDEVNIEHAFVASVVEGRRFEALRVGQRVLFEPADAVTPTARRVMVLEP